MKTDKIIDAQYLSGHLKHCSCDDVACCCLCGPRKEGDGLLIENLGLWRRSCEQQVATHLCGYLLEARTFHPGRNSWEVASDSLRLPLKHSRHHAPKISIYLSFFLSFFLQSFFCLSFFLFSPPARWGLLDFMPVAFSSPLLFSSSSPLFLLLNHNHPRPVFLAGPQPRPSTPSIPCQTSNASIHAQCSLPDLNREYPRPVFLAGPEPRPSTPSVPCRTSTTTIHAQCSLPDLECEYPRPKFPVMVGITRSKVIVLSFCSFFLYLSLSNTSVLSILSILTMLRTYLKYFQYLKYSSIFMMYLKYLKYLNYFSTLPAIHPSFLLLFFLSCSFYFFRSLSFFSYSIYLSFFVSACLSIYLIKSNLI